MYESPNQETPVYNAKGIETVRRDGCPAVAKVRIHSLFIFSINAKGQLLIAFSYLLIEIIKNSCFCYALSLQFLVMLNYMVQ